MSNLAYRYAHADTFIKMLESQALWFSDLRRMNDWDEYSAGFRIASEIAEEEFPQYKNLLAEISLEQMRADFMVLICSFSLDGDCLSMWRGYGDNGAGAAIGYSYSDIQMQHLFDRYLAKMAPVQGTVQFFNVIYDEAAFKEEIRSWFARVTKVATLHQEFQPVQLGMLKAALIRLCTLYKNDFFVDERELRGFIEVNEQADSYTLGVRDSGFGQADYHQVQACGSGIPAIREVVLGPRCELTVEEVKAKLITCELSNVSIRQSRGTYR